MADVTITPYDNGPLVVAGDLKITDAEGREIKPPGATIALCRCGASNMKPFCDGTHAKVGFESKVTGG